MKLLNIHQAVAVVASDARHYDKFHNHNGTYGSLAEYRENLYSHFGKYPDCFSKSAPNNEDFRPGIGEGHFDTVACIK